MDGEYKELEDFFLGKTERKASRKFRRTLTYKICHPIFGKWSKDNLSRLEFVLILNGGLGSGVIFWLPFAHGGFDLITNWTLGFVGFLLNSAVTLLIMHYIDNVLRPFD